MTLQGMFSDQGVVMVRRLLASVFLAAFPVVVIPIAVTSIGARAGAAPPTAVQLCTDGGWQSLTIVQGQPFGNQGQCVSYFIHNPVSLADLAGSFSGTTSFTPGTGGCPITQPFDATYPGSSAVGAVTLHIGGCVSLISLFPEQFGYTGFFAVATNVGTLSGNAAGPITSVVPNTCPTCDFELTLTVLSGTGVFAATTGTINVSILWPGGTPLPFSR
jgi:hypothetical protein